MRGERCAVAIAMSAMLWLSACGGAKSPELMNIRSSTDGPDEFGILPTKPLEMPKDFASLPAPTPGGANLTDPTPDADAIVALGGRPDSVGSRGVPAADGQLAQYAGRYGTSSDIRDTLASEDLKWRRDNNGRILERLFNVNVYYRAYSKQSLDQHGELERWRAQGLRTESAPPRKAGE